MPDHPPPAPDWVLGDDGHWKPPAYSASEPGAALPKAGPAPVAAAPPEPPTAPRASLGLAIAVVVLVVAVAAAGIFVLTRGDTREPAVAGPIVVDDGPAPTTEPPTTTAPTTTTFPSTTAAPATTVAPTAPPTTAPVPTAAPPPTTPIWCPDVGGLDGPGPVGHDLAATGLEADLGSADMCLYDGGATVAARWPGRTDDDLEADDSGLSNFRFDGNDGEHGYVYYDGDTDLGCATYATVDTVYGACGWVGGGHPLLFDLHQAIKDAVG